MKTRTLMTCLLLSALTVACGDDVTDVPTTPTQADAATSDQGHAPEADADPWDPDPKLDQGVVDPDDGVAPDLDAGTTPDPDDGVEPDPDDGVEPDPDQGVGPDPDAAPEPDLGPNPPEATLSLHALDIWGQDLRGGQLSVTLNGQAVALQRAGVVYTFALEDVGEYRVRLTALDHETLEARVRFDGGNAANALRVTDRPAEHGLSLAHDPGVTTEHTVYLGLRHAWFSAQARPARHGNRVELLPDGERAFEDIYNHLQGAVDEILVTTWWWDSEFELIRDWDPDLSEGERAPNTLFEIFADSNAHKRVLVGEFWGDHSLLDWMTSDEALRAVAQAPNDGFEFMGQGNPTSGQFWFEPDTFNFGDRIAARFPAVELDDEPDITSRIPARDIDLADIPGGFEFQIASYHQKLFVIDHETAFVGGMNLTGQDWDTNEHLVYDPRRMAFEADANARQDVVTHDELPDNVPVKDYFIRIDGPSAQDVAKVFQDRWRLMMSEGVEYSENATDFEVERDLPIYADDVQVQITTTLPNPFWEHGIAESWFNAVSQAENYIYIEDQYWRIPMLMDVIVARMDARPSLQLVVVTQAVNEWTDPGCAWTYITDEELRNRFPGRYHTFRVRAFDTFEWGFIDETNASFVDLYLHAKMLVIDDRFMSVGSANKNNRGLIFEGEMNVAVLDDAWVRSARREMLALLLPHGTPATNDSSVWIRQLQDAASHNDAVYTAWDDAGWDLNQNGAPLDAEYEPEGFVYPLVMGVLADCLIENIGPDIFSH